MVFEKMMLTFANSICTYDHIYGRQNVVGRDKRQMYGLSLCNESAFKLQRRKVKHIFLTSIKT